MRWPGHLDVRLRMSLRQTGRRVRSLRSGRYGPGSACSVSPQLDRCERTTGRPRYDSDPALISPRERPAAAEPLCKGIAPETRYGGPENASGCAREQEAAQSGGLPRPSRRPRHAERPRSGRRTQPSGNAAGTGTAQLDLLTDRPMALPTAAEGRYPNSRSIQSPMLTRRIAPVAAAATTPMIF